MPFIRHIAETVAYLKRQGITTLIVTTANQQFAQAVADKFGFDQQHTEPSLKYTLMVALATG